MALPKPAKHFPTNAMYLGITAFNKLIANI